MKRLRFLLLVTLACLLQTQTFAQARLTGKIKEHRDAEYRITQYIDADRQDDTIKVAPDGSFDITVKVSKPNVAYLVCEEPKAFETIFLEDKMTAHLEVSFAQKERYGEMVTVLDVDYSGDNKDCFDYSHIGSQVPGYMKWTWDKLSVTDFATYRKDVEQDIENQLGRLFTVKSEAFKKMTGRQLERERFTDLCRWAWAKHEKPDADFERWILSFDHNDMANMDKIGNYWRWYSEQNMPPRNQRTANSYYQLLQQAFTNQDIINYFAVDWASQKIKAAPEDIREQLAAFKAVSTNEKDIAEVEKLYNHYLKLSVGSPAADFDFYDKNGKKYTLKDFRGKAVYIDCWATWCGPCVLEIPHMEKLYAHYKNNKKVELISISLDDSKSKWVKKINEDKPGWRQFIVNDNFKSKLCQNYHINSIPRFLMFDKKGNIISLEAPRPSNKQIIEWIDSHLK